MDGRTTAVVVHAPRPEPEAGHLPLPAVRPAPARPERAHAAVPRGRPQPSAACARRLRHGRAKGRPPAHTRGMAEDPAPPTEPLAAPGRPPPPPRGRLTAMHNVPNRPRTSRLLHLSAMHNVPNRPRTSRLLHLSIDTMLMWPFPALAA